LKINKKTRQLKLPSTFIMAENLLETSHPLARGGTSRSQRNLRALAPAAAPFDARSEAELLEYLFQLAKVLVYHDLSLQKSDWQDFFRAALPFQLSLIGQYDTDALLQDFEQANLDFESGLSKGDLTPLFARVFNMALLLNRWHTQLPEQSGLKRELYNLINENLRFALQDLLNLSNSAQKADIGYEQSENLQPLFSNLAWQLQPIAISLPGSGLRGSVQMKKQSARERLQELFNLFQQGVERIVKTAPVYFEESLTFSNHTPHTGLIYTFLKLFQFLRNDLNDLTRRHLEFYYRDVLGLKEKPAVPDSAHLVLQLDKGVPQHLLQADILFKAGKDPNPPKAEIHFNLPEETVLNQAAVENVRTLYRHQHAETGEPLPAFYSAGAANSADGAGAPFEKPEEAVWETLGHNAAQNGGTLPQARVGFLIASPTLLLNEGNGRIALKFDGTAIPDLTSLSGKFKVSYSGKKDWIEIPVAKQAWGKTIDDANDSTSVTFSIEAEPLTFADAKILKEDYRTTDPILKLELLSTTSGYLADYDNLMQANISGITLTVAADRVRNLLLSNDDGALDGNKPFMPFGALPHVGSSFYVGCDEAFRKRLTKLETTVAWDNLPSDFNAYYEGYDPKPSNFTYQLELLNNSQWGLVDTSSNLFTEPPIINDSNVLNASPRLREPLLPLDPNSISAFFKMRLNGDFGHSQFPDLLIEKSIANATNKLASAPSDALKNVVSTLRPPFNPDPTLEVTLDLCNFVINSKLNSVNTAIDNITLDYKKLPNEPYTPTIREFSISYRAEATLGANELSFVHLHPFEANNHEKVGVGATLLPEFPDEGTLYIGLKNVLPGGTLSLLFQLAEATADPEIGDAPLEWAYLVDNEWRELRKQFEVLDDQTMGLIASGIVRLSIPFNISSTGTTILPNTLNWIKVSAKEKTAAVSDTIAVHAQAVRTTFLPKPDNDTSRLSDPLKPKTISKLEVGDAALKKIEQPYESFGGIPAEAPGEFYRRAGERLRHKGRAITLYDYERMVLEEFPEVFKVKCITHTLARNPRLGEEDFYLAPGYVALAVIPDMKRFSFEAKLRPKASSALLRRIEDFLQKRSTTFVRIKAVNPVFEEISIDTKVVFKEGKDKPFFENQLKEDVRRFLTPWAFGEQERLSFGGKIYRSDVLHFVEQLDYVDYVFDFKLLDPEGVDQQFIEASSERSILASGEHVVTAFDKGKTPNLPVPGTAGQIGHTAMPDFKLLGNDSDDSPEPSECPPEDSSNPSSN
jgi:hypothetical protein